MSDTTDALSAASAWMLRELKAMALSRGRTAQQAQADALWSEAGAKPCAPDWFVEACERVAMERRQVPRRAPYSGHIMSCGCIGHVCRCDTGGRWIRA